MMTQAKRLLAVVVALALLGGPVPGARAAVTAGVGQADPTSTPPRLSYREGEVSFWRPGADDWTPAQINIPLAPGDELYTADRANLELQVGSRAFVRASGDTQLGLVNQDPDFLQIKVTSGRVAVDLRSLDSGTTVEVDTPQAALTIERPGYYSVDVSQDRTSFITRRGGRATVTPAGGQAVALAASEEMILEGLPTPMVRSYVAPELDTWDRWNYARTEHLLEAVSARYVPPGVYGTDALDQYGNWREVPTYGAVWVPQAVAPGWVPYSAGRWMADPVYGWTWVDTAPWGWAPYHYGRWVFVDGIWAWAPGPVVQRAVYAPALVVFFGGPSVRVAIGTPFVSWVALGWGEPVVPWWGRSGFAGRPSWRGWGGPRIVNNVVVNQNTVVNVNTINVYRNVSVHNAVVAVSQEHFGRTPVHEARMTHVDVQRLEPVHGQLRVTPEASSFVAASGPARRPPESALARSVVATRPLPARHSVPRGETRSPAPAVSPSTPVAAAPAPRIVPAPRRSEAVPVPARPTFGTSPLERPRPAQPPGLETTQRPEAAPAVTHQAEPRPEATPPVPREIGRGGQPVQPAERQPAEHQPAERQPAERQMERRSDATSPVREPRRGAQPAQPVERPAERRPEATPPVPREPVRGGQPAQPVERQVERRPEATPPTAREPGRGAQPAQPIERRAAAQPLPQPLSGNRPAAQAPAPAPAPSPAPAPQRVEPAPPSPRPLPGEPANRLYPGRVENRSPRAEEQRSAHAPQPGAAAGPSRGPGQRQG